MPNVLVIRDRPLSLIDPVRASGAKAKLTVKDLWHLEAIGLKRARAKKGFDVDGSGVTIAVLDTGINEDHPELAGKVFGAYTFDTTAWREVVQAPASDTDGHGTHVAGLIVGRTVGVAPCAKILSGVMIPNGHGNLSDFVLALEWAAARPEVQIINMSAGIPGYVDGMKTVVADLLAVGVLPVFAIGNEGRNHTRSPGNYSEAFAVGAIGRDKKVWASSGGGMLSPFGHQYYMPIVVAPGHEVFSSVMGGGFEAWSGTSMAAPIVSGLASLILQRNPRITLAELKEALVASCLDLKDSPDRQGHGLVQYA